jgi:superfamily I DNA/RNA helicase
MKTNLILGPPGTGKTTYLINTIKELLKAGYKIEQIAYISFTKAAVKEAIERCFIEFPDIKKKEYIFFRTLHSLAYAERELKQSQVISSKDLIKFQDIMGNRGININYKFSEDNHNNLKSIPLYLLHIATNKQKTVEEIYNADFYDVSFDTVQYVTDSYKEFKNYYNVIDFNDMLDYDFQPIEGVKVVFLDESQDLTPLQWDLFYRLFGKVEKIFIAGDDDQSIYEWSGVDVNKFVNIEYDKKTVLKQSFRISKSIHQQSSKIVKRISQRFEKEFNPRKAKGLVEKVTYIEDLKQRLIENKKEGWFFLVRNNYLSHKIKTILFQIGVPFIEYGQSSLNKKDVQAIVDWTAGNYNEALKQYTNKSDFKDTWFKAFNFMDIDISNYYRDCLRNGFKLTDRPQIEITTIHKSKGREADNVVLMTDCSKNSHRYTDSEHRVYYVAVTRARNNLYILEPETNIYYEV